MSSSDVLINPNELTQTDMACNIFASNFVREKVIIWQSFLVQQQNVSKFNRIAP